MKLKFVKISEEEKSKIIEQVTEEVYKAIIEEVPEDKIFELAINVEIIGDYFPTITIDVDIDIDPFLGKDPKEVIDKAIQRGFDLAQKLIDELRRQKQTPQAEQPL